MAGHMTSTQIGTLHFIFNYIGKDEFLIYKKPKGFIHLKLQSSELFREEKDSNAKGLRNKPFTYYNNWCVLFGKDRATDDLAEGPEEAVAAMNEEELQTNDDPLPEDIEFSANVTTHVQSGPSSGRKRSRNEGIFAGLTTIAEQFGIFFERSDSRMGEIAQHIGYAQDLSDSRMMVYAELMKMPLETCNRLKGASMTVSDEHKVDLFFSLLEEDSYEWVYMLGGEI